MERVVKRESYTVELSWVCDFAFAISIECCGIVRRVWGGVHVVSRAVLEDVERFNCIEVIYVGAFLETGVFCA